MLVEFQLDDLLMCLRLVQVSVVPILFEMVAARRQNSKKGGLADDGLPKGPARWRPG